MITVGVGIYGLVKLRLGLQLGLSIAFGIVLPSGVFIWQECGPPCGLGVTHVPRVESSLNPSLLVRRPHGKHTADGRVLGVGQPG